ncbi:hypothetical protein ACRQ5Q_14540 [Bradyrhizobium sp. PMVTL-01]|uniref:hypothetical protein n=1 Tax=Bradyrhizobium sp. PMVTL-01 TaxID=3434999 RepID=UPI003F6FD474
MSRKLRITATDTPIVVRGDNWCITAPAGRDIECGQEFDGNEGYRVVVRFTDSTMRNSLSVDGARLISATLREQAVGNEDALHLADQLDLMANACATLNAGWFAVGKPFGGFDSLAHGSA